MIWLMYHKNLGFQAVSPHLVRDRFLRSPEARLTPTIDSPSPRTSAPEWTLDDFQDLNSPERDPTEDGDLAQNPAAKRQRGETSALDGIAAKISAIKPSLSRKWKSRRMSPTIVMPGVSREPSLSRANSTRAPSFSSATMEGSKSYPYQLPPTPTRSAMDESFEENHGRGRDFPDRDIDESHLDAEEDQANPTTPLLPPLMTSIIPDHIKEIPYQSPLQSPSVADPETASICHSPAPTPQVTSLPSPPLSSRPSVASFHRHHSLRGRAGPAHTNVPYIIPSSEIPPHPLDSPQDEWTDTLGHANFHIVPEPYCPTHPSAPACERLRQDYLCAQETFRKHHAHVAEHHGPTSKTYLLTEEKWSKIDAVWKRNVEACAAAGAISGGDGSEYDYESCDTSHSEAAPTAFASVQSSPVPGENSPISAAAAVMEMSPQPSYPASLAIDNVADADFSNLPSPVPTVSGPATTVRTNSQPQTPTPQRPYRVPKRPAKFPTPGENGIVGPMEVVASRRALEAQVDRSEAAGTDWVSPNKNPGSTKRKRKWGSVFSFRWMMERFSGDGLVKARA